MKLEREKRIVMTLDAGGTNFVFSAIQGNSEIVEPVTLPSHANDLDVCLATIVSGFTEIKKQLPARAVAISFAFPGPADYPAGIIGDLGNLPVFRGGVALGPMLQEVFQLPVFINNDGDLFAYGEAIAGFLPYVNGLLEKAHSPKRFHNLFGVTLGTGLGGGIVRNGELFIGDNSGAGEIWLMRNKADFSVNAEEGASIRAVQRVYAQLAGITFEQAPTPKEIFEIGIGTTRGNTAAALEAYRQLGEVVGDALANALTLIDGLAVIGGGLSGAHSLFLPALAAEMNGKYHLPGGKNFPRLEVNVYNLENEDECEIFLTGAKKEITVPGTSRSVQYDPLRRVCVGISKLGTSAAVAIGAYAFALHALDRK